MPTLQVTRSITIAVSREEVFKTLKDFKSWPQWSPWIIAEPDCKLTFSDNGKSYAWEGKYIGAGEMTVAEASRPKLMVSNLQFLKPFKSTAVTRFDLQELSESETKLIWSMESSLPFFLFFMKDMMISMIGMDYDRGLAMLKCYLEDGLVPSKLEFETISSPELWVVGLRKTSMMSEIGQSMQECACRLKEIFEQEGIHTAGKGVGIYHKWNPRKQMAEYTMGFLFDTVPVAIEEHCEVVQIPATPAFSVTHTGPYSFLGNAWSAGINRARNGGFRQNKKIDAFEIYENMPGEVDDNDLVAVVHFPTK